MLPTSLGLLLSALLLNIARAECPGERPTKHILCYVSEISAQFNPCLCTHLVLQAPLDKLSQNSGLVREARRLQEVNPSLRLVLRAQESAELALKRRGGYAQSVLQAVVKSGVDDVEVALGWGRQVAGKLQLVDFVQTLSKELAKLEPKSSSNVVDSLVDDVTNPDRKKNVRKTREAEGAEEEKSTTEKDKEATTEKDKEAEEDEEPAQEPSRQIILHLSSEPQLLAKNFDLKRLSKYVSLFTLASDNLTDASEHGFAYHPSRLMGIEDILNADSLIDLVTGLGAPRDKLVLTLPATALKFTLQDKEQNMPQSKVTGEPSRISRAELCTLMSAGGWTVERDEDLTAPYAFHDTTWLAFDDPTSVSIKGKYVLLRDLAGAAVASADAEDWLSKCSNTSLLTTLQHTFTELARQPRAAQLLSLQDQLHEAGHSSYSGDIQLSPYRIVRVVDREGSIHVVRKEAKTEFECSRQGYFRHPSGCNRFYRCVKFNQLTPDFTVFEYDCPAGLAFDETVEVCVWPGSLADGGACQGSSEIAPVPRSRYVCPEVAGYYADPENCRWFFACIDHQGDGSGLTAYEFRCPFGLVFDEQALVCNWPWLVPGCGGAGVYRARFTVGDFYEGRHRPSYASLSDVHVSGGRIENVAGGVVLDSAVNGLGSGAYLGSYAAGSNALGAGVYSAEGAYQANGLGYSGAAAVGDAYSSDISGQGAYVAGGQGSRGSGSYSSGNGVGYTTGSGSGAYLAGGSVVDNAIVQGAGYRSGAGYVAGSSGAGNTAGSSGAGYSAGLSGAGYAAGSSVAGSSGAGYTAGSSGAGYSAGSSGAGYAAGSSGAGYAAGSSGAGYAAGSSGAGYTAGSSGAGYAAGTGSGSYVAGLSGSSGSGAYNAGGAGAGYVAGQTGTAYSSGAGSHQAGHSGSVGNVAYNVRPGSAYAYGSQGVAGGYSGASLMANSYGGVGTYGSYDNSGAYIHDNSGDYIHDNSGDYKGDLLGLYVGKQSSGGQYAEGYLSGGAYVHGDYDNGAYRGSSSSGGQYEGNYIGAVPYSGSYDRGSYQGSSGKYKEELDSSLYAGKHGASGYSGQYSGGAYSGSSDSGAYSGKYSGGAYSGSADAGSYSGQYNGGAYSGSADAGSYSGKYNGGAYSGTADAGSYSGKYNGGAYSGSAGSSAYSSQTSGGAYSGSADSGAYSGKYNGGAYSHQEGYNVKTVPASGQLVTDAGYGSHEYNGVNVVEHHPAVTVTGGDHTSSTYVSSHATPSSASVTPVTFSYSTTPRPLTYYPVPSSPVTPVPSKPLIAYSTVQPPIAVQSYKQPSYVQTVPSYSYPTPIIGVVKSPVVPLSPVTYTYKQPATSHASVNSYQQSYVQAVTPASVEYSYQKPLEQAYLSPLPSYSYDYKPSVTYGQKVEVKESYYKPAVVDTIQYSTPAPIAHPVSPVTYASPAPVPVIKPVYTPTVLKTPIVPYNPVQYTTSSPAYIRYSTPAPVRTVSYSTPAPVVSYQESLKPVTYTTPAPPASYEYLPPRPIQPLQPLQPINYSNQVHEYNVPTVFKTAAVPLNPIQYSTQRPVVYTTPAPAVSYEYSSHAVLQPVSQVKIAAPVVRPVVPVFKSNPVVPYNPIQYTTLAPSTYEFGYSTPAPATYVKPVAPKVTYQYSTPAPPTYVKPVAPEVTYQYSTPAPPTYVKPVAPKVTYQYSTPAPPTYVKPVAPEVTYQYSTPAPPPARPVVYSAPAPVSYVKPVAPAVTYHHSTPAPPTYVAPEVTYQYSRPAPPPARPIVYSTPAPPVVSHVVPVVLKTPVPPLNPVQYTTPAPVYYQQSTPSPTTYASPSPAVNYQYLPPAPVERVRPLKPVVYSAPATQVNVDYIPSAPLRPVRPITYSAPAPQLNREYLPAAPAQPLRPITYSAPQTVVNYEYSAPVVPTVYKNPLPPLNPIQYTTPAPVHFEYSTPAPVRPVTYTTPAPTVSSVRPITLSSPAPFSYQYQPVQQAPSVLNPPVVPLNPVQYSTPAPSIVRYSGPVRPVTYTTPAPQVSYVKPVPTVLKTPVIPLNPVQYTTSAPAVNTYQFGVTYQKPEVQYQPEVYYQRPAVVRTQGYDYPRPSVKFVETPQVVSTTPAPTVTYTHETPEPAAPLYKQVYNFIKAPVVSAYDKMLSTISYSTTPLPVQTVTQSPVTYAPVNVGSSYRRPALVKTPAIPVTPVHVVPEYQEVLNVVKATTTPSPLYVNHYSTVAPARPVVYKQQPIVVPETYNKDYSYEENIEDTYDTVKSDFGTRLVGAYGGGYVRNQQKVVVPEVVAYTPTTPAAVPVLKVRRPVKTYLPAYEQPAVAVGYEAGSYDKGAVVYSTTSAPVVVSSSEAAFGEQYHKETLYSGYAGHAGDAVTPCDHGVTSTTEGTLLKVNLPVVSPQKGYYVRKQVRVRPVVTTENYPDVYSSTYTPSTVSTTTYRTTSAPKVAYSTTAHPDDVVDIEGEEEEEEEVKLLAGYNKQFGGIVGEGGYSASSTVSSIEDGEAVVGVLHKGRVTFDGRRTKSKVVVVSKLSDFNPLLVGKLGAECSCDGKSEAITVRSKHRGSARLFTPSRDSTIPDQQLVDTYRTSTSTLAPIIVTESSSYDTPVVEIRPIRKKVRYQSSTTTFSPDAYLEASEAPYPVPAGNDRVKADSVLCKRAGLFRHPNKCNKFYSCDWDQWKKKFTLHEFKCPIHLAYDINLGACNWPSKGPACAEDNLLV